MFVIYSEYTDKDEVNPRVQEILGFAKDEQEFFDYLKNYRIPDYMVFEEPKSHLPAGSHSFRISNNHTSIHIIAEVIESLDKAKIAQFPPEPAGAV